MRRIVTERLREVGSPDGGIAGADDWRKTPLVSHCVDDAHTRCDRTSHEDQPSATPSRLSPVPSAARLPLARLPWSG
jgi:hypothetical protein